MKTLVQNKRINTTSHLPNTVLFKQNIPDKKLQQKTTAHPQQKEEHDQWLVCSNCLHNITRPENGITIQSKHMHRFVNPEGYYFEIVCFNRAPGCTTSGESTSDFTWFPGFQWQLALCGICSLHLGWKYISTETSFFGLINDRIINIEKAL